jgi:putative ABC transport system substrate-binding protein
MSKPWGDPDFRKQIADFALTHRLPAMNGFKLFVDVGGPMAYGASLSDLLWRAAGYVDKILRSDLPVEQPTKFELIINLKTAKALGIDIPPMLLARADELIE